MEFFLKLCSSGNSKTFQRQLRKHLTAMDREFLETKHVTEGDKSIWQNKWNAAGKKLLGT
jgi:hypothetical protein